MDTLEFSRTSRFRQTAHGVSTRNQRSYPTPASVTQHPRRTYSDHNKSPADRACPASPGRARGARGRAPARRPPRPLGPGKGGDPASRGRPPQPGRRRSRRGPEPARPKVPPGPRTPRPTSSGDAADNQRRLRCDGASAPTRLRRPARPDRRGRSPHRPKPPPGPRTPRPTGESAEGDVSERLWRPPQPARMQATARPRRSLGRPRHSWSPPGPACGSRPAAAGSCRPAGRPC